VRSGRWQTTIALPRVKDLWNRLVTGGLTPRRRFGHALRVTVTALGSAGNIDTNGQVTVTFSTTDPDSGVVWPADDTFALLVGGDNGVHPFSGGATLVTADDQTLTVTDTVSGITGGVTVTVGARP
jgi:hypothetical protein